MHLSLIIKGLISSLALFSLTVFAQTSGESYDQWLKDKFANQHQQLIPVVAVADMYFSCNKARKTEKKQYAIKVLITEVDRDQLANKLALCLGDDTVKSSVAVNFGLTGCFFEQFSHLPEDDRRAKMKLVAQALASLSLAQRQESFTKCVTDQAIGYLK